MDLFKPTVYTTAQVKDFGPLMRGPRCTRTKYALTILASMLPGFILTLYLVSTSGSKHPDGPAGSAIVYLFRESVPILLALVATCVMIVVLFFASLGRFRDINASPIWGLFYFVPFLDFALIALLLIVPGTKGSNKYGADPRSNAPEENFQTADNQYGGSTEASLVLNQTESEVSKLGRLRNWATHQNLHVTDEQIDIHESVKQLLSNKELIKVLKKDGKVGSASVIVVGFDKTNSKYYMSVSALGTPVEQFQKEYFINYELMCSSLLSKTGLHIEDLADEYS